MRRSFSLRVWLMAALVIVAAVPLLIAVYVGIERYRGALTLEGQRSLATNINVAMDGLSDVVIATQADAQRLAGDPRSIAADAGALQAELVAEAKRSDLTLMAVTDGAGNVIAASSGRPHATSWPLLAKGMG